MTPESYVYEIMEVIISQATHEECLAFTRAHSLSLQKLATGNRLPALRRDQTVEFGAGHIFLSLPPAKT